MKPRLISYGQKCNYIPKLKQELRHKYAFSSPPFISRKLRRSSKNNYPQGPTKYEIIILDEVCSFKSVCINKPRNIMKVLVLLKLSSGQQYFTYTNYILTPLCVSVCLIALHQKQINCFEEISLFFLLLAKIKYA